MEDPTQVQELLNQEDNKNHDDDDSYYNLDITGASILRVSVSRTASGSQSEYLPNVYKPLYKKPK